MNFSCARILKVISKKLTYIEQNEATIHSSPLLALSVTLLLGGCATQMSTDPSAPTGPPAATVKI
jgi:hypothetical protein